MSRCGWDFLSTLGDMGVDELERKADALLKCQPTPSRFRPYYTESYLLAKMRKHQCSNGFRQPDDHEDGTRMLWIPRLAPFELGELIAYIRAADLTRGQKECLSWWLPGYTFVEIGVIRDTTKQIAHKLTKQALLKIRLVAADNTTFGLHDVIRSEMLRA